MLRRREQLSTSEEVQQSKWQQVLWSGAIAGWARQMEGEEYEGREWEFSAELPGVTDPESVKLGFSADAELRQNFYTISYKLMNSGVWQLLMYRETTDSGNFLSVFSAHISGELEKQVGSSNMDRQSQAEPIEL
ncbi:hypothetical protein IH980_01585 [Patescibacteria group bacterium]|nr:hypothetical protein [Patescibacteria group bacterium]